MVMGYETTVFVCFSINPIKITYRDSLRNYLIENIWQGNLDADEDVVIGDYRFGTPQALDVIRYQFCDITKAEERCDEISHLIEKNLINWLALNKISGNS